MDVRVNPTLFLVIAYSVRRLPYMVRSAVAGLQQTSVTFEESAANLGAGPATTLRRITLPLIAANLIAGALLAFAFSMLEVSDSLMLAQRADFYLITKTIYELFGLIGTGKSSPRSESGPWSLTVTILGSSSFRPQTRRPLPRVTGASQQHEAHPSRHLPLPALTVLRSGLMYRLAI